MSEAVRGRKDAGGDSKEEAGSKPLEEAWIVLRQSAYIFGAKITGYALRLVVPIVLVRLLPQAVYGEYRQFFLLQTLASTLLQFGMIQALYYFVPRERSKGPSFLLNSLLMNGAALVVLAAALAGHQDAVAGFLGTEVLRATYWEVVGYTGVMMFIVSLDAFFLASGRVRASAAFEIGGQLVTSASTLVAALTAGGIRGVVWGILAGRIVHLIAATIYFLRSCGGLKGIVFLYGLKEQLTYGIVLGAGGTIATLGMRAHEVFVTHYYDAADYAVYSVGCTDLPFLRLYAQALIVVALREFAVLERDGRWERMSELWRRLLGTLYAVGIPYVVVLLVFARPLVKFLFTERYLEAVPIFQAASILKLGLLYNASVVLRAQKRNGVVLLWNAVALGISLPAYYLGREWWGLAGVALAHAVVQVWVRVLLVVVANRGLPVRLALVPRWSDLSDFWRKVFVEAKMRIGLLLGGVGRGVK